MRACLDSWALLSWLDGEEPGAGTVDEVLARERPAVSWINLVEVHCRTSRDHGAANAERTLEELRPRISESLPKVSAMRAAAALKAAHPMALADCFAVALAAAEHAVLLTGDPEILDLAEKLPCQVHDLRPARGV